MLLPGGRWNSHRVCYFNFSSWVLSRTSSHMCGRWYLPMFLLRYGLLALMYNASFIHLLRFLVFPPHYVKIFYGDMVTSSVKMVIYRRRCLEVFFEPLSKCSRGLSNVFLIAFHPVTLVSINDFTFFWMVSWSFGAIRRFLIVLPPLK